MTDATSRPQTGAPSSTSRGKKSGPAYRPASLGERLLYGGLMAAASLGPLLLPGIRSRTVMVGYIAVGLLAYVVVCVLGMAQGLGMMRPRG